MNATETVRSSLPRTTVRATESPAASRASQRSSTSATGGAVDRHEQVALAELGARCRRTLLDTGDEEAGPVGQSDLAAHPPGPGAGDEADAEAPAAEGLTLEEAGETVAQRRRDRLGQVEALAQAGGCSAQPPVPRRRAADRPRRRGRAGRCARRRPSPVDHVGPGTRRRPAPRSRASPAARSSSGRDRPPGRRRGRRARPTRRGRRRRCRPRGSRGRGRDRWRAREPCSARPPKPTSVVLSRRLWRLVITRPAATTRPLPRPRLPMRTVAGPMRVDRPGHDLVDVLCWHGSSPGSLVVVSMSP